MIKLEKTSNLIEALVEQHGVVIWNEDFKQMAEESDIELNEVVRLADIGRATEKVFDEYDRVLFVKYHPVGEHDFDYERYVDVNNSPTLYSVEELLEWAKGGK